MDDTGANGRARLPRRTRLAGAGLVAGGLAIGAILAGTSIAGAQSATPGATPSATAPASNGGLDPATVDHGPGETLLKDGDATKAEAAALAEVPGGTVVRVETDSDGAAFEAHVQKADGSVVTVKMDEDFTVTSTESGFGGGPQGAALPDGANG